MTDLTWVREEENELPEAVRELVREAHSENTRRAYRSDLRAFRKWGGDVPTNPHELARYIAEEGERLHPSPTIQRRLAAISVAHTLSGGSLDILPTTLSSRQLYGAYRESQESRRTRPHR